MGAMSVWHWVIVLMVILLLFGAKRLPDLAKGMGSAIKNFKKEISDNERTSDEKSQQGENIHRVENVQNLKAANTAQVKDGEKA